MRKFQDKYRIPSARWYLWDYGSPAWYFVTICTKLHVSFFGEIIEIIEPYAPVETQDIASQSVIPTVETQHFASLQPDSTNIEIQKFESVPMTAVLKPTEVGKMAYQCWMDIPKHFPFVVLDVFVVMPNHIHGLIYFDKPSYETWQTNTFGPQSQNLGSVLRGYKIGVTKFANAHKIPFGWQERFHDHVVRNEKEFYLIRNYILNNPNKWREDKFYKP